MGDVPLPAWTKPKFDLDSAESAESRVTDTYAQ